MSHRVLSDAEFASKVNAGGATRRISDHSVPTTGYQVSLPTRGLEGSDGSYQPHGPISATQAHTHQKYLEAAHGGGAGDDNVGPHVGGHGGYQGGWHDAQTGVTHLDRSVRIHHPGLARSLGQSANQIAIWDNNTSTEVRLKGVNPLGYGRKPKGSRNSDYSDSSGRVRPKQ